MSWTRRRSLGAMAAVSALAGVASVQRVRAQGAYPARPVRVLVPDPPGGLPSSFARLIFDGLSKRMGQPFVIENRPGAGGAIGTKLLLQEPADGYTLLFTYLSNQVITPLVHQPAPYHPLNDFTPIALAIVNTGGFLVVNAASTIRTPQDLIAQAKARPGKLTFASAGIGSITHLTIELIKKRTGTYILHVPFNGPTAPMLAVAAGDADIAVAGSLAAALPLVKGGKLRLLARLGEKRAPDHPDVPTLAEAAVPGLVIPFWMGVAGRAGLPAEVVARLNREINAVLATDAEIRKAAAISYLETVEGPPSLLRDAIERDFDTFGRIVRDNRITADS